MDPIQAPAAVDPAIFGHVRIVISMVTGLSVARPLNGLARIVQHPGRDRVYAVHLGWVAFLLLSVLHFWWFEFALSRVHIWTFERYAFVVSYASLFFFICAILFPDRLDDYDGYRDYFRSRQTWFFGLMAALFAIDLIDTRLKGADHFASLGIEYPIRQVLLIGISLTAMFVKRDWFQRSFVGVALVAQIWFVLRQFDVLQ